MYVDLYTAKIEAQAKTQDLARSYMNARFDQVWLAGKLGAVLAAMAGWLAAWSEHLQTQPRQLALAPVRTSRANLRR